MGEPKNTNDIPKSRDKKKDWTVFQPSTAPLSFHALLKLAANICGIFRESFNDYNGISGLFVNPNVKYTMQQQVRYWHDGSGKLCRDFPYKAQKTRWTMRVNEKKISSTLHYAFLLAEKSQPKKWMLSKWPISLQAWYLIILRWIVVNKGSLLCGFIFNKKSSPWSIWCCRKHCYWMFHVSFVKRWLLCENGNITQGLGAIVKKGFYSHASDRAKFHRGGLFNDLQHSTSSNKFIF